MFKRNRLTETPAALCECSAIPTPHHPGWCEDFTGAPDAASWDAFELVTLSEWSRRLY